MHFNLLPYLTPILEPVFNGLVKSFNDASGRTMQQNLEGQRLAHQKELQEKQITAQFEIEYMRTMSQIKLQQNNQEFQEKQITAQFEIEYMRTMSQIKLQQNNQEFQERLEIARKEFQGKIVEYQCEENRKLQEFIKAVDMQIAKSNQEFQAWLFKQEKQHQIELCQLKLEAQYFTALCQRETALEIKEYDNWPLKNSALQILKSNQGCNPIPVQIILVPPQIDFELFEDFNKTSDSHSSIEKNLSQYLKSFLQQHYTLENKERPVKLIDNTWKSNFFAGYGAVLTIFNQLKSEPILLIESTVNEEFINIQVAYWAGGQEIHPFYKEIISKLNYRRIIDEFAIKRALHWETNIKQKLLEKGYTEIEINQRFGEDNIENLSAYKEYKKIQEDVGIEIKTSYKIKSEDFNNFLKLLGTYHKIVTSLFIDTHYLICNNLSPKLPQLFLELKEEFLIEQNLADDLFKMVIESYVNLLKSMTKDRSELVAQIAVNIALDLISLSDSSLVERMLDFSLESWLKSRHISIENNREKIDIVADNLLPLDQEFIGKVNRCLGNLGKQKNLDVINSCYYRANNNLQIEKYQAAIIDFSDVINLNPSHAKAHHFRGHAYYNLGEYQQALDDYNQAIDLGRNEALKDKREVEKKIRLEKELSKGELFNFEVVRVNASGSIVNRRQESARQKVEDLGNGIKLEMVYIPGGTFTMGSPESEKESDDDERPQHDVTVPHFFIGKYPVTQGQWRAIASQTDLKVELDLKPDPSRFKEPYKGIDRWKRPVEKVNWYQAVEFCTRLSKLTGRKYRLPSEAEWEYACRAKTTTPFYFGETITPELVNYDGNYTYGDGPKGEYRGQTTPVGQFPANAFGLYDMHGNLWEWCVDDWHSDYTVALNDASPRLSENQNTTEKSIKVIRGGSWCNNPGWCRSASRSDYYSDVAGDDDIGFRLVSFPPRTLK